MLNRITSFRLEWYDFGLCCADDVVQERITISRNKKQLVFEQLNGYGNVVSTEEIRIETPLVEDFFDFLEEADGQWETDYRVEVCDGSSWEVLMRDSTHQTRKICGTIDYPPCGPEIEKFIIKVIEEDESLATPIMFGCAELD